MLDQAEIRLFFKPRTKKVYVFVTVFVAYERGSKNCVPILYLSATEKIVFASV